MRERVEVLGVRPSVHVGLRVLRGDVVKLINFLKALCIAILDALYGYDSHSVNRYRGMK